MEIADQGNRTAGVVQALTDFRHLRYAASGELTVMRTSSEPASASSITCRTVAATSAVSVLVIDCTTTGASEPTMTCPT